MLNREKLERVFSIVARAEQDGITPQEFMKRVIQGTIARHSPFIKPDNPFIIMGIDGVNGEMFPCGSSPTVEGALVMIREKQGEESVYSDGDDVSTTFHIFTREGIHIPIL